MARARRKFHELHENQRSQIAADALVIFRTLYDRACTMFTFITAPTLRFPPYRGIFLKCFRPFVASWPAPSASGRSESGRRFLTRGTSVPSSRHTQQLSRKQDKTSGPRARELVVCWIAARWETRRSDYERHTIREAQRTRSVPLSQRYARASADSPGQPD